MNIKEEEKEEEGSPDPDAVVDANLEGEGKLDKEENVEEEEKAGEFKVHLSQHATLSLKYLKVGGCCDILITNFMVYLRWRFNLG